MRAGDARDEFHAKEGCGATDRFGERGRSFEGLHESDDDGVGFETGLFVGAGALSASQRRSHEAVVDDGNRLVTGLADRLAEPGRDQRQPPGQWRGPRLAALGSDKAEAGDPLGDRHGDVLGRAEQRYEPVRLPVLGDVADARSQGPGPVPRPQHVITEPDLADVDRGRAGHDPGQSGRARAAQPGDAHPLPAPHGQRHVAEEHARGGVGHAVHD